MARENAVAVCIARMVLLPCERVGACFWLWIWLLVRCAVCVGIARNRQATQLPRWREAIKTYTRISYLSNAHGLP